MVPQVKPLGSILVRIGWLGNAGWKGIDGRKLPAGRHFDDKASPFAGRAFEPNLSAVLIDNLLAHRQAKPRPL